MLSIKRKAHPMKRSLAPRKKRKTKPKIKLENAPPVESIKDLIEIGRKIKFYRNLDTSMLWRITPYLEELDNMIGMESLKDTIFLQVMYYIQGFHTRNKNDYLHTAIYGSPGSGKTTIAKIIGKLYQAMEIISPNGVFKIGHRDDFVAGYLGQSAIKTRKFLKSCLGGVLFIDEAYSLGPRNNDRDSFAKEAIDTINGFLSEHKNDFCCIVAGYEDEIIKCFYGMNGGLESRFPWKHRIGEYSSEDLSRIYMKMLKEINWEYSFELKELVNIFEKNKEFFQSAGRDIENYLTRCKLYHSKRVFSLGKEHKFIITVEDLNGALEMSKENAHEDFDEPPPGMYM